ncbi:MAG: hypothetical protein JO111_10160 [Caulobacteraceae bacterium]|nr:hypothetical protein [Caulobacteraceae bacterium]
MKSKAGIAGVVAGLALALATAAQADMVLDCQVQANRPDHGMTHWRRQIVINPATRTVRISDDFGHGLLQRDEYAFVSMNMRRIVLEEHEGKLSYVDRMSGEYVLRNQRARFMLRGHCSGAH